MKIKRYSLKKGTTLEQIQKFAKENVYSGWIDGNSQNITNVTHFGQDVIGCLFTEFEIVVGGMEYNLSINIGFKEDTSDWNDFDNVLLIDEDFGQPYLSFYEKNYGKDTDELEYCPQLLRYAIETYNWYLDMIPFLEELKEEEEDKKLNNNNENKQLIKDLEQIKSFIEYEAPLDWCVTINKVIEILKEKES